jgi:dTDP-4-amino-4,6-dideoxygalactose transaminase
MGLSILPYMETIVLERKKIIDYYNQKLDFSKLRTLKIRENTLWNYGYYPVIFNNEQELLTVEHALNEQQIFPRRYFYPSLNTIEYAKGKVMPISEKIASAILCLPLFVGLSESEIELICGIINRNVC